MVLISGAVLSCMALLKHISVQSLEHTNIQSLHYVFRGRGNWSSVLLFRDALGRVSAFYKSLRLYI